MSYDIYLFKPVPGEDPMASKDYILDEECTEPPSTEVEERKKRIAATLVEKYPSLEISESNFEEIAKMYHISMDEARLRHRDIELFGPDDGSGILINILIIQFPSPFHTGTQMMKQEKFFQKSRTMLKLLKRRDLLHMTLNWIRLSISE